jgi:LmbE family N-acetylglucosaminyl deacetylase
MSRTSKLLAKFLTVFSYFICCVPVHAQQPFSGTPSLEQSLHKLNNLGTVLMIAAHPDDERTAVLAYFARGRHMRTAYLSLTRGEGGQNLIGSEQGAEMGLIRTQELLNAREVDGAQQFFTRAIDFGFSKTAAETLAKWGHDRILSDVVWVIRSYRPDVIINGFTGTPFDGHGQHQTSAILSKEAFTAAADPTRFPEQLKYVQPWKPRREVFAEFPPQFNIPRQAGLKPAGSADTGAFNPILGYSYEELAVLSRSMHHSQGTGAMRRPGPSTSPFSLVEGEPVTGDDLFDGIDTTWNRLPGGAPIGALIAEAIHQFNPAHPEQAIPALTKARPLIAAISDPLAKAKLLELDEAIAACAGLWIEAQPKQASVTPGSDLGVTLTVQNRSSASVTFEGARLEGMWNDALPNGAAKLAFNKPLNIEFARKVPDAQPFTQPYWLAKPPSGDVYAVDDQKLIGQPDSPPVAQVRVRLTVDGAPIEIVRPVEYRYAERTQGERVRRLVVEPPVAVDLSDSFAIFPDTAARTVHVAVKGNVPDVSGELRLDLPAGWSAEPRSRAFRVAVPGEAQELSFAVTPPPAESIATLHAIATVGSREVAVGIKVIAYPHIPTQTLFPRSNLKLVRCDIRVTARRIGYIMGAGDAMPDALRQLGLEVTLLSPSDLEQGDLSRFDAIVAGVRAYSVRPDLRASQPRLMDYVRNGGTYIVQYQDGTGSFNFGGRGGPAVNNAPPLNIGPYPITVPAGNGSRITVEEAPVAFPHPDSPLLRTPNRITEADFAGWVQERGLNFATQWDPHYQTVLSSHDPGEAALEGGELWTRYGKGAFIFTAYSWFRELPAGVPGAYRLFANLLSAGR